MTVPWRGGLVVAVVAWGAMRGVDGWHRLHWSVVRRASLSLHRASSIEHRAAHRPVTQRPGPAHTSAIPNYSEPQGWPSAPLHYPATPQHLKNKTNPQLLSLNWTSLQWFPARPATFFSILHSAHHLNLRRETFVPHIFKLCSSSSFLSVCFFWRLLRGLLGAGSGG